MATRQKIACVTGATGMVGQEISKKLVSDGYTVRILSRKVSFHDANIQKFTGSLLDKEILAEFLDSADLVFHCAAELHDTRKMRESNVVGTQYLVEACQRACISYFCFISSAGVVGLNKSLWVTELSYCNPQDEYERTKLEAENLVMSGSGGMKTVVLRPTNVISYERPGAFLLPIKAGASEKLKIFIKGGECAHVVHVHDVADAAMHFINYEIKRPECFFVGQDEDPLNTFAGIWSLYKSFASPGTNIQRPFYLPTQVATLLRGIFRGKWGRGYVRYSSEKLKAYGFFGSFNLRVIASDLVSYKND